MKSNLQGNIIQPVSLQLHYPLFCQHIQRWQFPDAYVGRMLKHDVPQIVQNEGGRIFAYLDDQRQCVGFSSFQIANVFSNLTGGKPHYYIPLLAVHPDHHGKGHVNYILQHLIGEAKILLSMPGSFLSQELYLDVYETNVRAIRAYERNGFTRLLSKFDPEEGQNYLIMARRLTE